MDSELADNLKLFLNKKGYNISNIDYEKKVNKIDDETYIIFMKKKDKKKISVEQLRIMINICLKINARKVFLVAEDPIAPSDLSKLASFSPYIDIEVIPTDFFLVKLGEMYMDDFDIQIIDRDVFIKECGITDPENTLPIMSIDDHVSRWNNLKKGTIVKIKSDRETIFKIIL